MSSLFSRHTFFSPAVLRVVLLLCVLIPPLPLLAERGPTSIDREFTIPKGFEGRIAFWRYVFAKYGENHRIFHHRDEPGIIYSVLDFSEINENIKGRANLRAREKAVEDEIERIKTALGNLAKGREPKNELERRIVQSFKRYLSTSKSEYKKAAVTKQIRYQRGIKERFREGLVRSGRYLYAIENIFKVEGLPIGLARLPHVESSFDYTAYSSVGAAGIWQFMRATGKQYMRIDASIDERRDPILATRAAARYLSDAYQRLGSWPLAITSYNHGVAGVQRAVKQTGSKDLSVIVKKYSSRTFGFASSNFYAEFLAALEVERNVSFYFPELKREEPWYFDEVRIGKSVKFSDVARSVQVSTDTLAEYNLAFRKPVTSNRVWIPRGSVVKLPRGTKDRFLAQVANSEVVSLSAPAAESKSNLKYSYTGGSGGYRVRRGDTLGTIAQRHNVSTKELAAVNGISNPRYIRIGQKLHIPGASAGASARATAAGTYVVASGDTLSQIAARHGVSTASLKSANGISNPRNIRAGQKLRIPNVTGGRVSPPAAQTKYIVKRGDTLIGIARAHGMSLKRLKALNPSTNRLINPGQSLTVE